VFLNEIASRRHRLTHRSSVFAFGALLVSNSQTAKSLQTAEIEQFHYSELINLISDCNRLELRLRYTINPTDPIWAVPRYLEFVRQPWRYIPAPQKTQNRPPKKAPGFIYQSDP
jgi:hypothetical protein